MGSPYSRTGDSYLGGHERLVLTQGEIYIKLAQFNVTGDGYRQLRVAWSSPYDDVLVRVSLLGGPSQFAWVDDFVISCFSS